MPAFQVSVPTHLCVFATHPVTGLPVTGLPLYAEVAAPKFPPLPSVDEHFRDPLGQTLNDEEPGIDAAARERMEAAVLQAIAVMLGAASQEHLLHNRDQIVELAHRVFRAMRDRAHKDRLADIPPADVDALAREGLGEAADEMQLGVQPPLEDTGIIWAEPLGMLVTDHVGYASFDLKRLRPDVQWMLAQAIEARRTGANAETRLAIWVYPYGYPGKFDALSQARFSFDAVVARLDLNGSNTPSVNLNYVGARSLQGPSLTDWRLSPASFAASPNTLVGEDGCEELVPSNVALKEFVLRQVVRVNDPPGGVDIPADYRFAYVDDYKVSWYSLGHSLGEILYSLPLAPAESVKLAVIDWSWDSLTHRDETTRLTEEVLHQTHRDREITETVKAALQEYQHGSSLMGGMASSAGATGGANVGVVGLGAAVGNAWSMGGSIATSDGSRELAAENVQRLSDSFSQASSAQREINSTVVVQARQEEKESIQTRTFTNYNHSHTMTVLYYEVLRHYRIVVEWVRRRPAVLAKIPDRIETFNAKELIDHRYLLEAALLDPSLKTAFDALEKQEMIREFQKTNHIDASNQPKPPLWEGDFEFSLFEIGIKTAESDLTKSAVVAYVITAEQGVAEKKLELHYVYKGGHMPDKENAVHNINSGQRFSDNDAAQSTFVKPFDQTVGRYVSVKWKDIAGFQFEKWGDDDWRISFLSIMAFGNEGLAINLTAPEGLRDVDFYFVGKEPSSQSVTWFNRPGPRPAMPPPILTPEQSLTQEELHQISKLTAHVARFNDYYNRVILLNGDASAIAIKFEKKAWGAGSMMDNADPTPLEVFGSYVAYPMARDGAPSDDTLAVDLAAALNGNDPDRRMWAQDKLAAMDGPDRDQIMKLVALASVKSQRLITLPTRGVFAEGKLGHCNISEEIDNTRFWRWEEHPIPVEAPGINPVTPVTPSPQQVEASPTPFPQSLVNIVNPSAAPDPTGLSAALSLLGTPNIFRDMSGRQEVADLLKKLSDNTIAIAEAANRAREIQAKYGSANAATAPETGPAPPVREQPPTRQPVQIESDKIDNDAKKLDNAQKYLPPEQKKKVDEQVAKKWSTANKVWTVTLNSEWKGEKIVNKPMRASYIGELYLVGKESRLLSPTIEGNVLAKWDNIELAAEPIGAHFIAQDVEPFATSFAVEVPGITIDGLSLKETTYKVPLRTGANNFIRDLESNVDDLKIDPKSTLLRFRGIAEVASKQIEITVEVNEQGELTGDLSREISASGGVEKLLELAISATLKGGAKVSIEGKQGIKGNFEIVYLVGWKVNQII
jgi:hypothetical protein